MGENPDMASTDRHMVVIGAGMAGVCAARTLRKEGFEGRVTLLGADPAYPYDHVPLAKYYLRDEPGYHSVFIHDESFYPDRGIDLRRDAVVRAIDPAGHLVHLAGGEQLRYDKLLIATGSLNRRLDVPGADLDGIRQLRTLAEADRLKEAMAAGGRLVVVGSGFAGCEIASSARQLGLDVTLVGRDRLPMERVLGPATAQFYRDVHTSHGVRLCMETSAAQFSGGDGRVTSVLLTDGTHLPADLVVVAVGARPDVDLAAAAAGLAVENGILTDNLLATSAPDIYAAGDVANAPDPRTGRRLRVEHFATALAQGRTAARNMLGQGMAYDHVPFFFTDQYDVWMEYTGYPAPDVEPVIRGDIASGEFVVFWVRERRLVAAMNINIRGIPELVRAAIAQRQPVDPAKLVDPSFDLADLADAGA